MRRCQRHGVVGNNVLDDNVPKEARQLTAEEGHWSSCVKHTSKTRGRGEGMIHGHWTDVTLLEPAEKGPLLRCFFLLREKGNERAEWGGPPFVGKGRARAETGKTNTLEMGAWAFSERSPCVDAAETGDALTVSVSPYTQREVNVRKGTLY